MAGSFVDAARACCAWTLNDVISTRIQIARPRTLSALCLLVLLALLVLAAIAPNGVAAAEARVLRCGRVGSSVGGGYAHIRAYGVSCHEARRVIFSFGPPVPGWRIHHLDGYDKFTKGRAWITGVPLGD